MSDEWGIFIFLCGFGLTFFFFRHYMIKKEQENIRLEIEREEKLEEGKRRQQYWKNAIAYYEKFPKSERSKFREEARVDHLSQNFTSQNSRLNEDDIKQIGDIVAGTILAPSVYMHPSEPESPVIVSGGGGDFGGGGASDSWESSSSSSDSNTSGD